VTETAGVSGNSSGCTIYEHFLGPPNWERVKHAEPKGFGGMLLSSIKAVGVVWLKFGTSISDMSPMGSLSLPSLSS